MTAVSSSHPPIAAAHLLSSDNAIRLLDSDGHFGLGENEVQSRSLIYGENDLHAQERTPGWKRFLHQFDDPQMYLLFGATAMSLTVSVLQGHSFPIEACLILSIAVINALLGFLQEGRAERALAALRQISPATARVIRGGDHKTIAARELVPGDIIVLMEGGLVPADARVVATTSLQISEALLTGESGSIHKIVAPLPEGTPLSERMNMVFSGTAIVAGSGHAVVTAIGKNTEMGQIAELLAVSEEAASQLQVRIKLLSRRLVGVVGMIAATSVLCFLLLLRSRTLDAVTEVLLFGISLGVAAAPEALGTIITLTLAVGVHRLAHAGAIVRKLNAIDTLGGVTLIMSDKTGTLTLNRMTVAAMEQIGAGDRKNEELLLQGAVLANAANVSRTEEGWEAHGDPLDCALWNHALELGIDPAQTQSQFAVQREFPFTSERKMMSVLISDRTRGFRRLFIKGAPEVVLALCSRELPDRIALAQSRSEELAGKGLKVIAIAYRELGTNEVVPDSEESATLEHDMSFLGFAALHDPPRPQVKHSLAEAAGAGIRTVLITGDHPKTALSIAQRLGITETSDVLTGAQIDLLDDQHLSEAIARCSVLARVTPAHKMRAARTLQASGETVAMTGDGVNDAPALKAADIGIAMGSGTEIAKEAADIVLTDDNFSTIVRAIREGRVLSANIKKAVTYLISTNLCEVISLFVAALAAMVQWRHTVGNLPLPMTTPQILWINLMTDAAPALALALSPAGRNVMKGSVGKEFFDLLSKKRMYSIAASSLVMASSTLSMYFALSGSPLPLRRTMTVTTLILAQSMYAFTLHSESLSIMRYIRELRWLMLSVLFAIGMHLLLLAIPLGASAFGFVSLDGLNWMKCGAAASAILVFSEVRKAIQMRSLNQQSIAGRQIPHAVTTRSH